MATTKERLDAIFDQVAAERDAQDLEHGGPEHDDTHNERDFSAFIVRHLGRALEAKTAAAGRRQFVRGAALAVASIEWIDRMAAKQQVDAPGYPSDWPACPGCGRPALDGHITCGSLECDEAGRRR